MKKCFVLFIISLLLWSCASTLQFVDYPQTTKDLSKSYVYVIRSTVWGSAIKIKIYEGEKLIGKLGPKSYLLWELEPGKETSIISVSENKDTLTFAPEEGEQYYIEEKLKMGWMYARCDLKLLSKNNGKALLHKLKAPKSQNNE